MAAEATTELIKGTSSSVQWYGPYEFTEVINVKGCSGANFTVIEADAKSAAGVSTLSTAHSVKTSYYLRKVRTELITPTDVRIYATYRGYPDTEYRFEVFGALNAKTVNTDYDGYYLELTKPESLDDDNEADYYIEDAIVLMPQTVARLTKIGFGGPTRFQAMDDSIKYTGFLNNNSYLGRDIGTLLCTKYSLTDAGSGTGAFSWTRVVELQYDPDGWQMWKAYRLSNGIVYYDQDSNSERLFDIYGYVNFSPLWYET